MILTYIVGLVDCLKCCSLSLIFHCGQNGYKYGTNVLCLYSIKYVAFCSALNNIYNKILCNLEVSIKCIYNIFKKKSHSN